MEGLFSREITWKARGYLDLRGHAADRLAVVQAGLDVARAAGDRYDEGAFLTEFGRAYAGLGETRRAVQLYEQALVIDREIGDRRGEGAASWNLGLAYESEGDLARAAALMQVLVDYEQEIGHSDAAVHAEEIAAIRARLEDDGVSG